MEPCVWLPDRLKLCWWTQSTHSNIWPQLATMPQCVFTIGYRQSEQKRRNRDWRAICTATRCIGAGRRVVCHRGVSDGSDRVRPLWWSHSARTEMFFAHVWSPLAGLAAAGGVGWLGDGWPLASVAAFRRWICRLFLLMVLLLLLLLLKHLVFDMCHFRGRGLIEEFV